MRVKILESFSLKLADQIEFIAKDKPQAARKFRKDVLDVIKGVVDKPCINRKSIYYEDENIRDLIFKGYTIVYEVI